MERIKKILDPTMFRFLVVGVINTLFGTTIMFVGYNFLGLSLWVSSGANYFFGSILSYLLNKHYTFRSQEAGVGVVLRFSANILVCWLLAYGLAEPLVAWGLGTLEVSQKLQDNISMMVGMVLFTGLNYFGQRFFAFRKKEEENE